MPEHIYSTLVAPYAKLNWKRPLVILISGHWVGKDAGSLLTPNMQGIRISVSSGHSWFVYRLGGTHNFPNEFVMARVVCCSNSKDNLFRRNETREKKDAPWNDLGTFPNRNVDKGSETARQAFQYLFPPLPPYIKRRRQWQMGSESWYVNSPYFKCIMARPENSHVRLCWRTIQIQDDNQ